MQTMMPPGAAEPFFGSSKVGELEALYRLTDALYRAQSQEAVHEAALDAITGTLGCSRASILLFDEAGTMRFVAWRGLSETYRVALEGHSPWNAGEPAPEPIFVRDIDRTDEPEGVKATIRAEGIRALGFMPIVAEGVVIGKFMTYYEAPHEFAAREIDLALTIARQVGFSVERWRADRARRLAEADLRASEARFRLMAEHAPVMIWMSKPDGRCLNLNRRLREFWGVAEEDVEAFDWNETIHPEDIEALAGTVADAIAERRPFTLNARFRNVDGAFRILHTEAQPRLTPRGEFLGMIGVNVDTTERVRAEEALRASEARFRIVVEAAPSAMLIADGEGRIALVNANAEALFGYRRDELIGRRIESLVPLRFVGGEAVLRDGAGEGPASKPAGQELVGRRKDGTEIPIEIGLSRIETDEGTMAIASVNDISARKRTEAHRELLLSELKHRVRNTLAVVQGIAHQTFKGATPPALKAAFEGRLAALAAAHRLLTEENREGAWLAQLAADACEAAGPFARRVAMAGPPVFLPEKEALSVALALHELFTNAVKYGALSNETGSVALAWEQSGAPPWLRLVWQERGGPEVAEPSRQGFGGFLLHKTLARDLNGRVDIRYLPEGLVCTIEAPLPPERSDAP